MERAREKGYRLCMRYFDTLTLAHQCGKVPLPVLQSRVPSSHKATDVIICWRVGRIARGQF